MGEIWSKTWGTQERALEYTPGDGEITEALAYAKTQTAVE